MESLKKEDVYSVELANSTSCELNKLFSENASLLRTLGQAIKYGYEGNLKTIESLLLYTSEMPIESLTTSYISWASSEGYIIISGKSGILDDKKKSIKERNYFQASKNEPWTLKFSKPEKSMFSVKYVLPTAMGITDKKNRFLGYLVVGLRLDELRFRVEKNLSKPGYVVSIFDVNNQIYIPKYNSDSDSLKKKPNQFIIKKSLEEYPYEIHIEKLTGVVLYNSLKDELEFILILGVIFLFLVIITEIFIRKFVNQVIDLRNLLKSIVDKEDAFNLPINILEGQRIFSSINSYVNIITKEYKKNVTQVEILYKNKRLSEIALKNRDSYFRSSFLRIEREIEELDTCLRVIDECNLEEELKPMIRRAQDIIVKTKTFTYSKERIASFSFNSTINETLAYYANDFYDKEVDILKRYSEKIPLYEGDELLLKHILITVLGKILEGCFSLKRITIRTKLGQSDKNLFIVELEESLKTGSGFVPTSINDLALKIENSGVRLDLVRNGEKRIWYIECGKMEEEITPPIKHNYATKKLGCKKTALYLVPSHQDKS